VTGFSPLSLTRSAAIDAIGEYIDGFYNLTRHSILAIGATIP